MEEALTKYNELITATQEGGGETEWIEIEFLVDYDSEIHDGVMDWCWFVF